MGEASIDMPVYKDMGKQARLVEPVVLLMIRDQPGLHGYDLMSEMDRLAMTDSEVDAAAVYRTLRNLEEAGLVTSSWDTGSRGPAKRCYTITFRGLAQLCVWASVIDKRRLEMERFLSVYQEGH